MDVDLSIRGIQEVQAANNRRIALLTADGDLGQAVREITAFTHRQAVAVTHVDTGSLRASHRMEITGVRGRVYIDPNSINPRTGEKPAEYGEVEHARGGRHAFYRIAHRNTLKYAQQRLGELEKEVTK